MCGCSIDLITTRVLHRLREIHCVLLTHEHVSRDTRGRKEVLDFDEDYACHVNREQDLPRRFLVGAVIHLAFGSISLTGEC